MIDASRLDEAALERALNDRLLDESHTVELKREIPPGAGSNKELARDIAALAVDGGLLIVGIDENDAGTAPTLRPVPLDGLVERVDQVVRAHVQPALRVACSVIPAGARTGYVIVTVPTSPDAPHMVDGAYWARSDTTKYKCSDTEVRRILHTRQEGQQSAQTMLQVEIDRDPTPPDLREQAHLFIVAKPLLAVDLHEALERGGTTMRSWVQEVLHHGQMGQRAVAGWSPDLRGEAENVAQQLSRSRAVLLLHGP